MVAIVIMVATDMVDMLVMVDRKDRAGQDGTGRDRTGRDGTGRDKTDI